MCGISGIIYNNQDFDKIEITKITDVIKHRGPDGYGYYYDKNIALGHRRLSILDLSEKGKQPMEYLDKYIITFNGEIYNYIELREDLKLQGYKFDSDSDTEVVLAAYDFFHEKCLDKFNGMFSMAIYDKKLRTVFCARDRFGVKPFYYTQLKDKFVFCSEIKQILTLEGYQAFANKPRLRDFLINGQRDHSSQTLFENIYQLLGGNYMIYHLKDKKLDIIKWYDLKNNVHKLKKSKSFNKAMQDFKALFYDSVRLRLRSDVKVGSCLSGGLDSSAVVCVINELLTLENKEDKQETVSACFHQKEIDESEYIDYVIEKTDILSHKIYPEFSTFLKEFDKIVFHQDEPFNSTSIFAQMEVYRLAKKNNLIVLLDGQGADESLCGYYEFQNLYFSELLLHGKFLKLYKALKQYKILYNTDGVPLKIILINAVKPFFGFPFLKKLYRFLGRNTSVPFQKMEKYDDGFLYKRKNAWNICEESINQLTNSVIPRLLHHQDRDSMAYSVESRVPFLDYRLVEFALSLPSEYKINLSITKYIMRESLKGVFPDKIKNRYPKLGFVTPFENWVKENATVFRAILADSCDILEFALDKEMVVRTYDADLKRGSKLSLPYFFIISTAKWMKVFNVKLHE